MQAVRHPQESEEPLENRDQEIMPKSKLKTKENCVEDHEEEQDVDVDGDNLGLDHVYAVQDQYGEEDAKKIKQKLTNQHA